MRRFWSKKQPSHENEDYEIGNAALQFEVPASVCLYVHKHGREIYLFITYILFISFFETGNRLPKIVADLSSIDIVDPYQFCRFNPNKHLGRFPWFSYCIDQVARQVYLLLLFRLPSMYFERVTRVFCMLVKDGQHVKNMDGINVVERFDGLWLDFISTLVTELNTLNIVAALLLSLVLTLVFYKFFCVCSTNVFASAILSMLSNPDVANQGATRTLALLALVASLTTVVYSCLYIIRFNTMKSKRKAASFGAVCLRSSICPEILFLIVYTII